MTTFEKMQEIQEINSFELDCFIGTEQDHSFFIPVNAVEDITLKKVYHDMKNDLLDLNQINKHLQKLKKLNKKQSKQVKATVTRRKKCLKIN